MEAILIKMLGPMVISIVGAWIGKMVQGWIKSQKDYQVKQEAYEALEASVASIQQEFVDQAKEDLEGGKLPQEKIDEYRELARARALKIADDPNVIEAIIAMSWNTICGLIDLIVQSGKKKKGE